MIGVHCQLLIWRGHIRVPTNALTDSSMVKLISHTDFVIISGLILKYCIVNGLGGHNS